MESKGDDKIIVVDFRKKEKEERKKKDAIIYGNIIKRLGDEHLSPVNDIDDEPA